METYNIIPTLFENILLFEFEKINIQQIKEYNLYNLFLIFLEKVFLKKTSNIPFETNCPITQLIYDITILNVDLFDFENSKQKYLHTLNKLDNIINNTNFGNKNILNFLYHYKKIIIQNIQNLNINLYTNDELFNNTYNKGILDDIYELLNSINNHQLDKTTSLLDNFCIKYPNRGNLFIRYLNNIKNFYKSYNDDEILTCIQNINNIFDELETYFEIENEFFKVNKVLKNYNLTNEIRLKKKQNLCIQDTNIIDNNINYTFIYGSNNIISIFIDINNIYINDINHTSKIQDLINITNIDKKSLLYYNYIKDLIDKKSKLILDSLFCEYITLMSLQYLYKDCVIFYKKYKDVILYILRKSGNPLVKINVAYFIIRSNIECNIYIGVKDIINIINHCNIPKKLIIQNYSKILDYILSMKNKFEWVENYIISKGFEIKYITEINNECCMICQENIDENTTTMIYCKNCKKEIGHFKCILNWFNNKTSCPHCRYTP